MTFLCWLYMVMMMMMMINHSLLCMCMCTPYSVCVCVCINVVSVHEESLFFSYFYFSFFFLLTSLSCFPFLGTFRLGWYLIGREEGLYPSYPIPSHPIPSGKYFFASLVGSVCFDWNTWIWVLVRVTFLLVWVDLC